MVFTVIRSTDAAWETSPWMILRNDVVFLDGIQEETEAQSLADLLNHPAKVVSFRNPEAAPVIETDINGKVYVNPHRTAGRLGAKARWHKETGQSLLELALVLPIFLLLSLGGFDLLRLGNAKSDVDWIAATIADCSKTNTCGSTTAATLASGFGLDPNAISAVLAGSSAAISFNWVPVSPFFHAVTITSTATAP